MYYLLRFPVPQPGPRLASSTSHHPLPPQSRGPGLSFSRRNPSGASVASSRSELSYMKSLSMCTSQHTLDWLGHNGAQMVTIALSPQQVEPGIPDTFW